MHLSRIYRKLGVRSRAELARRFPDSASKDYGFPGFLEGYPRLASGHALVRRPSSSEEGSDSLQEASVRTRSAANAIELESGEMIR